MIKGEQGLVVHPVASTPSCRGHGFNPWLGNKDPTATKKKKNQKVKGRRDVISSDQRDPGDILKMSQNSALFHDIN